MKLNKESKYIFAIERNKFEKYFLDVPEVFVGVFKGSFHRRGDKFLTIMLTERYKDDIREDKIRFAQELKPGKVVVCQDYDIDENKKNGLREMGVVFD